MSDLKDCIWACSALTLQTNKNGFFKHFAENFENSLTTNNWQEFTNSETNENKIKFCLRNEFINQLNIIQFYREKNYKEALNSFEIAKKYLDNDKRNLALQYFNRCILLVPTVGEEERCILSKAMLYRAKTLISLGYYQLALYDTQAALATGNLQLLDRVKLLNLQGCAYENIKQYLRAKVAYNSALKLLGESEEKLKEEISNAVKRCEITENDKVKENCSEDFPSLKNGVGNIPYGCNMLEIKQDSILGRYIVAKENIECGDNLFIEPAFVACLLTEKSGSHCHHCLKRFIAPVGCPNCSGVAFCSRDCQTLACESYHKIECKFQNLFIGAGMSILCYIAMRIITRTGNAENFVKLWESIDDESVTSNDKSRYKEFIKLVSHQNKRKDKDFLHRSLMAIFLLKVLQASDFFPQVSSKGEDLNKYELIVVKALLIHLQIVQFNCHEVFETLSRKKNKIKGCKMEYIGVAVYPSVALLNHDCYPAVSRTFNGTTIIINAIRPLKIGDTVAENYGPIFTKLNKVQREKSLTSRYWFQCECKACIENWPNYDGMKTYTKDKESKELYDLAFKTMEDGDIDKAISLYEKFINLWHNKVNVPDREVSLCMDALRVCLSFRWGNVFEVLEDKKSIKD